MNKNRVLLVAGFMPPAIMGLLMLLGHAFSAEDMDHARIALVFLFQFLCFLLPALLIRLTAALSGEEYKLKISGFSRKAVPFILYIAVATSLFTFLVNCVLAVVLQQDLAQRDVLTGFIEQGQGVGFLVSLGLVVIPALSEEFFFRGALLPAFSEQGTATALFVSALSFALVHGSLRNLAGPMVAGLVYGYLSYALGSFWPAFIAHLINNLFYALFGYVFSAYSALGIWDYFIVICVLLFFLFFSLSMRSLERLIELGKIKRFKRTYIRDFGVALVFSPGLWLLIILFVLKTFYL